MTSSWTESVLPEQKQDLLHLTITSTWGAGELSNFILGAIFVFIAGTVYKKNKSRKTALLGSLIGAVVMAVLSVFSNYYITYPIYMNFMNFMPKEAIIAAYSAILPSVDNLWEALIIFNLPFNIFKGLLDTIICMLIYKKLNPLLKGK